MNDPTEARGRPETLFQAEGFRVSAFLVFGFRVSGFRVSGLPLASVIFFTVLKHIRPLWSDEEPGLTKLARRHESEAEVGVGSHRAGVVARSGSLGLVGQIQADPVCG